MFIKLKLAPLVGLLCLTAACGSSPSIRPAADQGAPKTVEAAQAAVQVSVDAYATGDWGGAWDRWTPAARALFGREDYIKLHTTCDTLTGVPFTVKSGRMEDDDTAVFQVERMGFALAYRAQYVDGAWWFEPTEKDRANYARGLDNVIKERCGDQASPDNE